MSNVIQKIWPGQFKIGDEVEWSTQANGYTRTKRGEVVAVVEAFHVPLREHKIDRPGLSREHESYIVRVRGQRTRNYWPRVSGLRKAKNA